jgi:hypothetical protein
MMAFQYAHIFMWKKAGIGGFKQGNRGACRIIPAKGR